jgi:ribonuclease-3
MEDFLKLKQNLKYNLTEELLKEALTHRSFINEAKNSALKHNERLEFIGDAVLELVVTEFLFLKYPEYPEGLLTSFRAALVKTESLAEESKRLEVGKFIIMSKGEENTGGRDRTYILANTFEAIIGAIYLSTGYEDAKSFIIENVCYKTEEIVKSREDIDSKTKLQELSQEVARLTPIYELKSENGPDHNKTFEMTVLIGEHEFGTGTGKSKQEAQQSAATNALKEWNNLYNKFFS